MVFDITKGDFEICVARELNLMRANPSTYSEERRRELAMAYFASEELDVVYSLLASAIIAPRSDCKREVVEALALLGISNDKSLESLLASVRHVCRIARILATTSDRRGGAN